jgi:hypothetical protein
VELQAALLRALLDASIGARKCDVGFQPQGTSTLVFEWTVASTPTEAKASIPRFRTIAKGAPVPQEVLDCIENSLPAQLIAAAPPGRPFLANYKGQVPFRISVGTDEPSTRRSDAGR